MSGDQRTIGVASLVSLGSIPPSISCITGLIGFLSALGLLGKCIPRLFKELLKLERVCCLLIQVSRFLKLGRRGRKPATG